MPAPINVNQIPDMFVLVRVLMRVVFRIWPKVHLR